MASLRSPGFPYVTVSLPCESARAGALGLGSHVRFGIRRAVDLAEGVAADDQCGGLVGGTEVRATLDHPPRDLRAGLVGVAEGTRPARCARIARDAAGVLRVVRVAGGKPVGGPFPHVAGDVVEPVAVGWGGPDGRGSLEAIQFEVLPGELALPGVRRRLTAREVFVNLLLCAALPGRDSRCRGESRTRADSGLAAGRAEATDDFTPPSVDVWGQVRPVRTRRVTRANRDAGEAVAVGKCDRYGEAGKDLAWSTVCYAESAVGRTAFSAARSRLSTPAKANDTHPEGIPTWSSRKLPALDDAVGAQ